MTDWECSHKPADAVYGKETLLVALRNSPFS